MCLCSLAESPRKPPMVKTADHHIPSIYGKMGVTTRAAAALHAVARDALKAGEAPAQRA